MQALTIIIVLILLSYPLLTAVYYNLVFKNKIYPKVFVLNIDMGSKTKSQALNLIKNKVQESNFNTIVLNYQNQQWQLDLNSLQFNWLPEKTADKAFLFGKQKELNILEKWKLWQQGKNFSLDWEINHNLLNQHIATIASKLNVPVVPPTIDLVLDQTGKKIIEVNPGRSGKELNQKNIINTISNQLSNLENNPLELALIDIYAVEDPEKLAETKTRAENLIDKKIKLEFNNEVWFLEDKEIVNFLNFEEGFNEVKIASYTAQLAKFIDQPPQNALFNFNQGRVTEFKPAQDGQTLDQKKAQLLLQEALLGLEKENNLATVSIPVNITKPQIATQDVNNLGIKEIIGTGESWFKGSIASRIHNVRLASQKLNGVLIPPGQTFSFNQTIGDISLQTGYQQAYIIQNGRTILGDGGGVCQVSTTLFRAVLDAGLEIEERQAHAYRVSYYEQNYQVGVDATVFSPKPDFVFKNDTPGHILIQSFMDETNSKLTFILYGTWDGRETTLSASRIWDQIPPPPDLYQDDPTLPQGIIKQIDWKAWGAKVSFDWKVVRGNEVLQEQTFSSYYKPWQAIYLKGTGSQ